MQRDDDAGLEPDRPAAGAPTVAAPTFAAAELRAEPTDDVSAETLSGARGRRPARFRRTTVLLAVLAIAALGFGVALGVTRLLYAGDAKNPKPTSTPTVPNSATADPSAGRAEAVDSMLATRARAVTSKDKALFLSTVDPSATDFYEAQAAMFDRVAGLDFADWSYVVTGDGPGLSADRAIALPRGAAIVRVRLTYRLAGTATTTDREQYLTVVPHEGAWLVASDSDAAASGQPTERDLWDLGPVRSVHGEHSLVLANPRGTTISAMRQLADSADQAVQDVDNVWPNQWSREPVLILPRTQDDMATLIGSDGRGLGQIAAVTTGSFESGLSRGDRIVINPAAWDTLGALGRRVVLTHEMTHVATRATGVQTVPIWLSEGFADYVAYRSVSLPTRVIASDLFDEIEHGRGPKQLPTDADFDAARGDVAASYESAWLAARMIAERYGQKQLVRFYVDLSDSAGPGWPAETVDVLGITERALVRDWRGYIRAKAAA